MRDVIVAGIGLTPFGKYDGSKTLPLKTFYELGGESILAALKDSGFNWQEIQAAFCGTVYSGTASGHQATGRIGLTGIPIVNVENACSSSASAFRLAYQAVATEMYDIVLAVGFESMSSGTVPATSWPEWQQKMGFNLQPASYALQAVRYMEETGAIVEDFARVSVKNRKNGTLNPKARFQREVTLEEVLASPVISSPLRFLNACPLADGGSAAILCSRKHWKHLHKAVEVAAAIITSGTYGYEYGGGIVNPKEPDCIALSTDQAWEVSGYGPEDMDLVQLYDTMSPGELWDLELMGFCKNGEAPWLLKEGAFDLNGRLPVNTDGGILSRGHPLGATGLAQIIEVVTQLRREAGPRQIKDAGIGLAHSMGAGPTSSVVILKT